jgi:FkbM family methyltransferase
MKLQEILFNKQQYQVKLRSQADKSVLAEIFELREYRGIESIIKSAREPIIDAGAQIGFFSLYCRALNPEVKIFALEPDEENLELLNKHLEINNLKNVEVIPAALSEKSGLRDFYISHDSHNHSLFKVLVPKITKNIKIKTYGLDDWLKEQRIKGVFLLKLDIEGAEYEVLENFVHWEKIKNIVLEYHDFGENNHKQLENLLLQQNYKVKSRASKFDQNLGFIFAIK